MKASFTLLCIDLPTDWHPPVRAAFQAASSHWFFANTIPEIEEILSTQSIDAVLTPIQALNLPPLAIIAWVHDRKPKIPVIIISERPSESITSLAQKMGAADIFVLSELDAKAGMGEENLKPTSFPIPPTGADAAPLPQQSAHDQFNRLVSLSPSVIFTCAPREKFPYLSVSNNLESLTGYSVASFLRNQNFWYDHIHPDDLKKVEEVSAQIFTSPTIGFDYRFRHRNGQYIWLHDEWRAVYSEAGQFSEIIGSTIDISKLKIAQEELQERLRLEEFILSIITRFINAPREQIDDAIYQVLSALGIFIHSDRTFFFLVNEDASELLETYEWHATEPEQIRHRFKGLPLANFSWSMDQLRAGNHFLIDRISDLPEEASRERDRWLNQGLYSMFAIPIHACNQFVGFIGASSTSPDDNWQEMDLSAFHLVQDAFANVWARLKTEDQLRESEERFRLLAENSKDVIALHEIHTNRILYISPSCARLTGYQPAELIGRQPKEFMVAEEWAKMKSLFARMLKLGLNSEIYEYHIHPREGGSIWVETTMQIIRNGSGEMNRYVSVTRDINQRKQTEAELLQVQSKMSAQVTELARRAEELATLSEMGNMLQVCSQMDEACNVIAQFAARLFPASSGYIATAVGKTNDLEVRQKWGQPSSISRRFRFNECWGIRRGHPNLKRDPNIGSNCDHFETPLPASYLCIPITNHSRSVALLHIQADQADILQEDQLQLATATAEQIGLGLTNLELRQSLTDRTRFDPLTGVLSRSFLEETLEVEFARACTTIQPLSLILLDIDHFREVNAAIGHFQADQLLINLAAIVQSVLEKEDILGRFGGDEFILLLPNTQMEAAYQRAEKLRVMLHSTYSTNGKSSSKPISISAGVACWPTHGETPNMLIRAVTLALEDAKKTRDQVALANLPSRSLSYPEDSNNHLT